MHHLISKIGWSAIAVATVLGLGCGENPAQKKTPVSEAPVPKAPAIVTSTDPAGSAPATAPDSQPNTSAEGDSAKVVELRTMDWQQLQTLVSSNLGKVVVVDLWSTACEPCLREFPKLIALQQRHPDDVVCISFDCDFDGRKNRTVDYYLPRVMEALSRMHAETIINGISSVAADELFEQVKLDSIPAVYVFDRTGKMAKRFDNRTPAGGTEEGISYETQIDPLVADLVKESNQK